MSLGMGRTMSIKATTAVWSIRNKELTAPLKYTLLALADFANKEMIAWPNPKTLAEMTNKSLRQIKRDIAKLASLGYVERLENAGGNGNFSKYKLLLNHVTHDTETMSPMTDLSPVNYDTDGQNYDTDGQNYVTHDTRSLYNHNDPKEENHTPPENEPSKLINAWIAQSAAKRPTTTQDGQDWYDSAKLLLDKFGDKALEMLSWAYAEKQKGPAKYRTSNLCRLTDHILRHQTTPTSNEAGEVWRVILAAVPRGEALPDVNKIPKEYHPILGPKWPEIEKGFRYGNGALESSQQIVNRLFGG